jgi:hypothetical protein
VEQLLTLVHQVKLVVPELKHKLIQIIIIILVVVEEVLIFILLQVELVV